MDTSQPRPKRPTSFLDRPGLVAAGLGILVLAVPMLVVGPPLVPPGPDPSASSGPGGPSPTPGEPWAALALEPFVDVATLAPNETDAAGIRPDTGFVLGSLTTEAAADMAGRLEVQPAAEFRVAPGTDASHVAVTPVEPLAPGRTYRFTLRAADGALAASWAFRVRGPLQVLSTLPGDRRTQVPVRTGIEVTFDQEGAADMGPFFAIEPTVAGRFERHGRTQVFVPARLEPRTVYTVTIRAGLPRAGTDLALEDDVVFRFETAGYLPSGQRFIVGRDVFEASPDQAPVLAVVTDSSPDASGTASPPPKATVHVHRFPNEGAALAALGSFLASSRWTEYSVPSLPVADLPRVLTFEATLENLPSRWDEGSNEWVIRFPAPLEPGWYAVEIPGSVPAYAFLQVTRVSAWVAVLTDRTVIWANDIVSHRPIDGATAALPGSAPFGTSGADGVLDAATPAALLPAAVSVDEASATEPPILVVRSGADSLLVPFDVGWRPELYRGEWWEEWNSGDETYWSLLYSDRWEYRTTDTVAIWGFLNTRDGASVPTSVDVRIVADSSWGVNAAPPIVSERIEPDASGLFSLRLPLERAPLGGYRIEAAVDGRVVVERGIQVDVLRKPEYQLTLAADRRAVIVGTAVNYTATATFFDGTPVPGLSFGLSELSDDDESPTLGPTDARGVATIVATATLPDWTTDSWDRRVEAWPSGPESGEISGGVDLLVFAAAEHLGATGVVDGGRLRVNGSLRTIDLVAVEEAIADGTWNGQPSGPPVGGRRITVVVTELVPVRTQTGNRYDFIEKLTVPVYAYRTDRRPVKSTTVSTTADGRLSLDLAVPEPGHQYEVALSTTDPEGRRVVRTITAGAAFEEPAWGDSIAFETPDGRVMGDDPFGELGGQVDDVRYGIGEQVDWTITNAGRPMPSGGQNRYLYIVAQRGLRTVTTSDSPTFARTFGAADAPGVFVMGIRFTGTTYAPKAAAWADIDFDERAIRVSLTADRARYRPGDDITVNVRTVDERGRPISADVIVQAVDEKLYAMGAAFTGDPLRELYRRVDSGIVRLTATHQVPTLSGGEGEGGSEGPGGARTDFRDMLAFVRIHTDADGNATTTFAASDDLTAWHVTAYALTTGLEVGVGELLVDVGLPLFASVTVADEYLLADRPAVRLRAFGRDLVAGDPVEFTVSSKTLGLAATTIASTAFGDAWFELPGLRLGRQELDVAVVAPTRLDATGKPLTDRLIATFGVVESRFTVDHAAYGVVGGTLPPVPADRAATYTFSDAGRGRWLPLLLDLVGSTSVRLDNGLAATTARSLLEDSFGWDPSSLPPESFDASRYEIHGWGEGFADWRQAGIALLPYGGPDPWLATRVASEDPGATYAEGLRPLLLAIRADVSLPRDLRIAAVAGLAALGEPVHADVAELRTLTDLTIFESIQLGLAAAALGDDATARSIERAILAAHGQRLGPWVRIEATSDRDDAAEMTALLAVLAARIGDPLAPSMLEYVRAHPSAETSHALEVVATIAALLERTPAAAGSFAYAVDGVRKVVRVEPGGAATFALTGPQRASLVLEPLTGKVGVTVAWREIADPAAIETDPSIVLTRQAPTSVPADGLVNVHLRATLTGGALDSGCYRVVEQVPSGLAPIEHAIGPGPAGDDPRFIGPSSVVGQEVTFCVPVGRGMPRAANLRYVARVISTGTYTWEPATMTLEGVPAVVTVTGESTLRIGE